VIEEFPFQKAHDAIVSMLHDYLAEKEHAERLEAEIARLKAEVERLDTLCKQLGKQHSDISCENIMLRKAGDALYKSMLEIGCNEMADNFQYDAWWGSMNAWLAAKETPPHA
jgi:hypothetical protein